MNSPSFCLSDIFISLTLLKENFDAYGILVFLSFSTLNILLDWPLTWFLMRSLGSSYACFSVVKAFCFLCVFSVPPPHPFGSFKFEYDMPTFFCVYFAWCPLNFLGLWLHVVIIFVESMHIIT